MANRKLLPIEELPIVGGALCLDLVNTTGARASTELRERLFDYDDLLVWTSRAGALGEAEIKQLADKAFERPFGARVTFQRACELREDLYRVFRPVADGGEPLPDDVARVTAWWRADQNRRELVSSEGGFALRVQGTENELDAMLWPVVSSAVELLTSDRLARIRHCGECDWLFVDESRNGTRTWCKNDCGNRARARRHYNGLHQRGSADLTSSTPDHP
jgi:predicted RNA-binding Zn ribbon-like protein